MCHLCERAWLGIYSKSKYAQKHLGKDYPFLKIQNGRGFNPFFDNPLKKFQRHVIYNEKKDSLRYNLDNKGWYQPIEKRWPLY